MAGSSKSIIVCRGRFWLRLPYWLLVRVWVRREWKITREAAASCIVTLPHPSTASAELPGEGWSPQQVFKYVRSQKMQSGLSVGKRRLCCFTLCYFHRLLYMFLSTVRMVYQSQLGFVQVDSQRITYGWLFLPFPSSHLIKSAVSMLKGQCIKSCTEK